MLNHYQMNSKNKLQIPNYLRHTIHRITHILFLFFVGVMLFTNTAFAQSGTYTIFGTDAFGDGWNGGQLTAMAPISGDVFYEGPINPINPIPGACLLYTSPSPRDGLLSRMPSSA